MGFLKKIVYFIKNVSKDPRIPPRDKKIILVLVALVISPFDLIPDWIPFIGLLDDLVLISIILDYFFNVLEPEILLSHYPWGMKSFATIRRLARIIATLTPSFIKKKIWSYTGNPYQP